MTQGILFCTPMYGGMCTEEYFRSCIQLRVPLITEGIAHDWFTLTKESLITRARNVCAAYFLQQTEFSHLMFIDADIGFKIEAVSALLNLGMPVTAGCYRMKEDDAPLAAWRDGAMVPLSQLPNKPFTVDYAGTGFMLIERCVFEEIRIKDPDIEYEEGKVGKCWAFFQDPIMDGFHCSEDYFFCHVWRTLCGGEVWMHPDACVNHVGTKVYAAERGAAEQSAAA